MEFLSINFAVFFLITAIINYVFPQKLRLIGLLLSSFVFYFIGAKQFFVLLLILCLITYAFGLILNKFRKKYVYAIGAFTILASLIYFKYTNFLLDLLNKISLAGTIEIGEIIAPLGISFMTFQAISYLGDVYYGKIPAEKNPIIVTLFVSFFPNVTSGPIQKAKNFIPAIKEKVTFDYDLVKHGMMLVAFGGLQKFFISDKLAPIINDMQSAFLQGNDAGGFHYVFFAFAYAIYLYSNFNSYSDIAIGVAEILGIRFSANFKRPYLSRSIREFWQRWHISLNSWFVDYVYIPLGGSRKGKLRYYVNILVVFLLSGLWHGASLHFVAWGLLNGVYQIAGNLTESLRNKIYSFLKINPSNIIIVFWKRFVVFYLVSISWIFFAIPSISLAAKMSVSMLVPSFSTLFDGWILNLFDSGKDIIVLLLAILAFAVVQFVREKTSFTSILKKCPAAIRYAIYVAVTLVLLNGFFGTFTGIGNGGFVYGEF